MLEVFAIVVLCLLIYFPTINYQIIVDDIRHADAIQKGLFNGRRGLDALKKRLYGIGTFARIVDCKACLGSRVIKAYGDETRKTLPCPRCQATGRAWDIDLKLEHGFTLAMHTLACVLIYLALGRNVTSLCAALLYAVNPTNMQTSVWLNGRRYLVNIIIVLLMVLIGPWGLPLYFLTPLFQVNAIFAPAVYGWWGLIISAGMIAYLWPRGIKTKVDERIKAVVNRDMRTFHPKRIRVTIKTIGFYVMQMVLPRRNMMVYPFMSRWGLSEDGNDDAYRYDIYFYCGVVVLILFSIGAFSLVGQERWWLIFMALALVQVSNIIPATQTIADRYAGMSNVFMMYFVAKFAGPAGSTILGLYYLLGLHAALPYLKGINEYYDYHLYFDPGGTIVRKFKINWMLKSNDVMGAWELIKAGLIRNPTDFSMNYQAAICMAQMGDPKGFENYLQKAEANHYLEQRDLWTKHFQELRDSMKHNSKRPGRNVSPIEYARRRK